MKVKLLILLLGCSLALPGQAGLGVPSAGFFRDDADMLRPLFGLRANFILGRPLFTGVRAAAFSGRNGLVKTEEDLFVLDRNGGVVSLREVGTGTALFAFALGGAPLAAYLPDSVELLLWRGGAWHVGPLPWELETRRVLGLGTGRFGQLVIVTAEKEASWKVEISPRTGRIFRETLLPGIGEPVLLLSGGTLLYDTGDGLVLRRYNGAEVKVPLPAPATSLEQMGKNWVHVVTASGNFGIRFAPDGGGFSICRLPEVAP